VNVAYLAAHKQCALVAMSDLRRKGMHETYYCPTKTNGKAEKERMPADREMIRRGNGQEI